jgi:hypothetical protein
MEPVEILEALLALADDVGLPVRIAKHAFDGEFGAPQASAICRVKGETWVVLADLDPIPKQIEVLARALQTAASSGLEDRYLPPAVRELLDMGSE